MSKLIRLEDAKAALQEAVKERGSDFRYVPEGSAARGCYYSAPYRDEDDEYVHISDRPLQAGCGVGLALHKLGVSLEQLRKMDCSGQSGFVAVGIVTVPLPKGFGITQAARHFLYEFQGMQDNGYEWGTALDRAKNRDYSCYDDTLPHTEGW